MHGTSLDLINRLIVHLERLRSVDPTAWTKLSRCPPDGQLTVEGIVESPELKLAADYRPRLLALVWPGIQSDIDAQVALDAAGAVCIGYGILAFLTCLLQDRWLAGLIIATFLAAAGLAITTGFKIAPALVLVFFGICLSANLLLFGWTTGSICLALSPLPLIGSFKAATYNFSIRQSPLVLLAALATTAALFGSLFGIYYTYRDSITPTLHPGDLVLGINMALTSPLKRGDLVEVMYSEPSTMRVAALPGDSVGESGQFISSGNYFLSGDDLLTKPDSISLVGPVSGDLIKKKVVAAASLNPFTLPRWVH